MLKKIRYHRNTLLFILALVLIAAIPRGIELLAQNYLFGFDQGVFYTDVKDIVVNKNPTLIGTEVGGAGGFFQGPGWYYLLAVPFVLFGGDPYGGMVLMFILGITTVLLSYFTFNAAFGKTEGFIASLLVAMSPIIITHSRFIWPPFPITFFAVVFLYALFRVFQKKGVYFPLLTFALGMMTHFETATAATLLASFVLFLPFIFYKKLVSWKYAFLGLLSLVLTQIALIIFDLRNDFLNIKGILGLISKPAVAVPFEEVFQNRWQVFRDNFFGTFSGGEFLWPFILGFMILGSLMYFKDKNNSFAGKSFLAYLLLSPVILFLIFLRYKTTMWGWWILELNIYYIAIFAVVSGYLWSKRTGRYVVILLMIAMSMFFIHSTIQFYKNDLNDFGGVHKIKGKIEAIDFIYKNSNGEDFNVQIFTPPIYYEDYNYLFWWYGQRNYGFIPVLKNEGTVYLLIEPDPHKPWTYEGWLQTVIKSGEIVLTKEFPSGFIVQKRIAK